MSPAAAIALVSAALAIHVAVVSLRYSSAPGWSDQRWFALAAGTVAGFAILDVAMTAPVAGAVVVWCSRAQLLMTGTHVLAWIRYSQEHVGARPGRLRAALAWIPLAVGAAALVPGLAFSGEVGRHTFAPLGITYQDALPTSAGSVVFAIQLGALAIVMLRYALAWRRGVPYALVHLLALCVLFATAVNDALVPSGVLATPYLIDLGFMVPVAAVAYAVAARLTSDARALDRLRRHLELEVEERTQALTRAEEQLHRSEKLAGLGRLAAGVAHEVSSPAAAAASNLRYALAAHRDDGTWPPDAAESLQDSLAALERIVRITRQLKDAGRLSGSPVTTRSLPLRELARAAVGLVAAKTAGRVALDVEVDAELHGLVQEDVLVRVLVSLVENAIQAIPADRSDGRVVVRGGRAEGRARLVVEDNGVGMAPDVLRRAFEPFFTTRPFGEGAGLGLAMSRGLVQGLGGELSIESAPDRGTKAIVDLPMIWRDAEAGPQRAS